MDEVVTVSYEDEKTVPSIVQWSVFVHIASKIVVYIVTVFSARWTATGVADAYSVITEITVVGATSGEGSGIAVAIGT
jgi:hypothetical protein